MENRHQQTADRQYHQPVEPHSGNHGSTVVSVIFGIIVLILIGVGIVEAHDQMAQVAIILTYVMVALALVIGPTLVVYPLWHKWHMDKIKRRHAELDAQAKADETRRANELHELTLRETHLAPDTSGNYPAVYNRYSGQVVIIPAGQFIANVPAHYAPHFHYQDTSTRVSEEKPAIQAPLLLPDKMLMLDVMRRWDLRPDNFFLAMGKGNQELACPISGLMHVAHDGPTDSGKTSQFYAEIIALLKLDVRVILCNPHFAPITKGGDDWRPIGQAIEAQGMIELAPGVHVPGLIRNYKSIANMLQWLSESEIDRRFTLQAQGMYTYKPIYIFVDEWPAVVRRFPEAADHQVDILQRGRAVEVDIDTNAQGFLAEDVALKGSARENFQTAFHMGGSVHSASRLLDMPVKDLNTLFKTEQVVLGKGIALLRNNASVPQAQLVRLPYANNDYCYYMLGRADNWILPEFRDKRNVSRDFRTEEVNGNISSDFRNTVKSDVEPIESDNPKFQGETNVKHKIDIPLETRNEIIRLRKRGFNRTEIRNAMGFSGEQFKMIKQTLDEEGL